MKYKIEFLEQKSPNWIVASLSDDSGKTEDYSINKVGKNGDLFPNFDTLKPGGEIEGNPWQNAKGVNYLFPPRNELQKGAVKGGGFTTKKGEEIKQAQQRKTESISYFNSVNSAISLVTSQGYQPRPTGDTEIKEALVHWRDWFLKEFEKWDSQPF